VSIRNKTLKCKILPQAEAKGSGRHMLASLGFRLRQYSQFLTIAVFVENVVLRRN
jgi:hypothetical protein